MTNLNDYIYVILGNKKHNLFIGFANEGNITTNKLQFVAQNDLPLAVFFNSYEDAQSFLLNYFNTQTKIREENKKFYEIIKIKTSNLKVNIDSEVMLLNTPCYFSGSMYFKWFNNPSNYSINM